MNMMATSLQKGRERNGEAAQHSDTTQAVSDPFSLDFPERILTQAVSTSTQAGSLYYPLSTSTHMAVNPKEWAWNKIMVRIAPSVMVNSR